MRNADILELTYAGAGMTQTVYVQRGTYQPHPGYVSYKRAEGDGAREFVPWAVLEKVRHIDRSRVDGR